MGCLQSIDFHSPKVEPQKVEPPKVEPQKVELKKPDILFVDLTTLEYKNTTPFFPQFKSGKVVKAYDADSCWIATYYQGQPVRFRIRLYGVDTPELKSKDPVIKAKAIFARDQVRARILGKIVQVEIFPQLEKNGRLLARLSDAQGSINDWLISSGMANPYFGGTKEGFEDE